MSNNLKKKRKSGYIDNQRLSTTSLYLLFPLFLIVTVLPLIVSMHSYSSRLGSYDWFSSNDTAYDFFLYYKQWFFVFIASLCLIILIIKAATDKSFIKIKFAFYPLFGYAILALLSTLFSEHRAFGFSGIFEQFENVFCLLGYVIICYYAFLMLQTEYDIKLIINALAIGSLIIGLIGSFQAFGLDLFNTSFGKSLIVEKGIDPTTLEMVFGKGRTYSTLYNPNYVGVYASMTIPLFAVLLFTKHKLFENALYISVIITQIISMFGAQSKTGLISLLVATIIAIILLGRLLLRRWYIVIPIIASSCIIFLGINTLQNNAYLNAIKNVLYNDNHPEPTLTNIVLTIDGVEVTYQNNTLQVSQSSTQELVFRDKNQSLLQTELVEVKDNYTEYKILDSRFEGISPIILYNDIVDFGLLINNVPWYFKYNTDTNEYQFYNRYGKFSPIEKAPSMIFTKNGHFGSGRGYIWSKTLPLLSNNIFLGSGADSFVFEFPQYDFVDMFNYGFNNQLISKPHSLYLQIGIQTGVISLICFLTFYIIYFVQGFYIYIRRKELNSLDMIGIALLVSSSSYMISGISNDSIITVAPTYWVLIGTGFAVNWIAKKNAS